MIEPSIPDFRDEAEQIARLIRSPVVDDGEAVDLIRKSLRLAFAQGGVTASLAVKRGLGLVKDAPAAG